MANNKMLIDASHPEETRVAVVRGNRIEEFDFESQAKRQLRGNIYLAKVTRVEPSLQAAFVDYGGNRHGFLAFSEIHPDYYQIPIADRQALLEEEAREADEAGDDDFSEPRERGNGRQSRRRRGRGDRQGGDRQGGDRPGGERRGRPEGDQRPGRERPVAAAEVPEAEPVGPLADSIDAGAEADDPETPGATMAAHNPVDEISEPAPSPDEDAGGDDGDEAPKPAARKRRTRRKTVAAEPEAAAEESEPVADAPADMSEPEGGDPAGEAAAGGEAEERHAGDDEEEHIESVGQEDALEEVPQRRKLRRQYKIQEVIKRRQIMLVQVVKEERGNKGAALTTYLSLAGRYCVLMPNTARGGGISRKITSANDRKRLKTIATDLEVPNGMGVILRTAGAARTKAEIKRDFEYLMRLWDNVRNLTLSSSAPCLVYEEGSLIKRSIRDLYDKNIGEIVVQGEGGYREAKDFMRMLMPSHAKNVKPYAETQSIFSRFGVESQLDRLLTPQVTLKSGGYIVINQTEALVSIDVNSGRSTREHSIEDTALQTNLEAAEEVARQLRLRDLAGLIVVDFIDMEEKRNNRSVEKRLKDALKNDRARIQVGRISHFGLLEMSRQRIRASVMESTMDVCPHCGGLGHVRSHASIALHVFRAIEDHVARHTRNDVTVRCPVAIALDVLNHKRAGLAELEDRYGIRITVVGDVSLPGQNFVVEKGEPATGTPREPTAPLAGYTVIEEEEDIVEEVEDEAEEEAEEPVSRDDGDRREARRNDGESDDGRRRRRRKRRRGRRGDGPSGGFESRDVSETFDDEEGDSGEADEPEEAGQATESAEAGSARKRRRGRRGGRKNRRPDGEEGFVETADAESYDDDGEEAADEAETEAGETEIVVTEAVIEETVATAAPAEPAAETETEEEANARRRRNTRRVAASAQADSAPAAATKTATVEAAEAPKAPQRKGWWNRGGFF